MTLVRPSNFGFSPGVKLARVEAKRCALYLKGVAPYRPLGQVGMRRLDVYIFIFHVRYSTCG